MRKLNSYLIHFWDFGISQSDTEIVKAMTAEDAVFIWESDQKNTYKHFERITAREDEDETGTNKGL